VQQTPRTSRWHGFENDEKAAAHRDLRVVVQGLAHACITHNVTHGHVVRRQRYCKDMIVPA
jgi:hypothetical protein